MSSGLLSKLLFEASLKIDITVSGKKCMPAITVKLKCNKIRFIYFNIFYGTHNAQLLGCPHRKCNRFVMNIGYKVLVMEDMLTGFPPMSMSNYGPTLTPFSYQSFKIR